MLFSSWPEIQVCWFPLCQKYRCVGFLGQKYRYVVFLLARNTGVLVSSLPEIQVCWFPLGQKYRYVGFHLARNIGMLVSSFSDGRLEILAFLVFAVG